ncbi:MULTISPECIES: FAD-dependent oxidoreductase [Streptomyces]|uniref:FAD-dependent oxidoreductase n=1 Tax=Streptomyces lonegramiae TaxID=3075524 RepID=A0ABU2X7V9_9ACTN|nr:FAD-dependent oxidoreductase [Streptomyces sp. DSM 41529]MDT0541457.1 FAD-dependent oxidoreductase [Streptomyces sp. DSM 41529]
MREIRTEFLVVGGGLGGVAAALTAARLGRTVVLTEATDWLGGQLTAQAVPPDEHPWIEGPAAPPGYAELRRRVRDYYRRNYPLRPEAAQDPLLDPGLGIVSRMCHEPRVAVAVIEEMLAPWRSSGAITVLTGYEPVAAHTDGDRVEAVTLTDRYDGHEITVHASYVADATELGDLLELANVEHVFGAEGRDETGEPHAPDTADPLDQQAVSWCFALEHRPGEDHVIDRPASYDHWRTTVAPFWPGPQLSFTDIVPITLQQRTWPLMGGGREAGEHFGLWEFRRILAREQLAAGAVASDLTVVNWPQIDYWEAPLLGVDAEQRQTALAASRDLSLSFLHWLQTEAPRPDGGTGWPGLRLRPDVTGTRDGLAKTPYIRESRRIRAEFTVLEQHVGVEARPPGSGGEVFHDSVGLGSYRIDLHPSTAGRTYIDIESYPFQIPLGALIPVRVDNLLPANKNIGTTHITNGCYRLHPVEWAIGEAVGALAGFCLDRALPPRKVRSDQAQLADYQHLLGQTLGIQLAWPEEIRSRAHHY